MEQFTDEYIESLETAEIIDGFPEMETDYFDAYSVGAGGRLGIHVTYRPQSKVWFLEYYYGSSLRRMTLGRYPTTNLEKARTLAATRLREYK